MYNHHTSLTALSIQEELSNNSAVTRCRVLLLYPLSCQKDGEF